LRFDNDPPVTVSAGLMTCVLRLSGSVVCYGDGTAEKFDRQGRTIDLGRKRARALSSGERHACAILEDESVVCWREQVQRLLPLDQVYWSGTASPGDAAVTVALGDVGRICGISAGDDHTCAWFESGKLKCWGQNEHGQLGLGDLTARGNRPDQMGNHLPFVDLGPEAEVVRVAAGPTTTCALLRDRRVKCWGYAYTTANAQGQLPTGDGIPEIPLVR
jgi:alpha-tubulin suppressor-like RCC1 family protein